MCVEKKQPCTLRRYTPPRSLIRFLVFIPYELSCHGIHGLVLGYPSFNPILLIMFFSINKLTSGYHFLDPRIRIGGIRSHHQDGSKPILQNIPKKWGMHPIRFYIPVTKHEKKKNKTNIFFVHIYLPKEIWGSKAIINTIQLPWEHSSHGIALPRGVGIAMEVLFSSSPSSEVDLMFERPRSGSLRSKLD